MSKAKVVKKTIKDKGLVDMFNSMLGGDGDPEIIAKKEVEMKALLRVIVSILKDFSTGPFKQFTEYNDWCVEFAKFSDDIKPIIDLDYKSIKEHDQTKRLTLVCSRIIEYTHYLQPDTLSDRWIKTHPGLVYEPFDFTKMDVKHIWNNPQATENVKKYCLRVISILFNKCFEVYKLITSPDVDVKKLSPIIIDSISKIRNLPQLSRCKKAFKKIEESVALLENNFGDYYKDMIINKNPNTIIESFISDVSKDQQMDMSLMREFTTIINFYKSQSEGKIKDPKIKAMFDTLGEQFKILEKHAEEKVSGSVDEILNTEEH